MARALSLTAPRWILASLLCLLSVGSLACRASGPSLDELLLSEKPVQAVPGPGEGVLGYNEPLVSQAQVGVRATTQGRLLAISVHNQSPDPIVVGPDQFRILLPDRRQYAFTKERNDLSGFPIREMAAGEKDVFTVAIGGMLTVEGMPLVYNYPPSEILLRVIIEPVRKSSTE